MSLCAAVAVAAAAVVIFTAADAALVVIFVIATCTLPVAVPVATAVVTAVATAIVVAIFVAIIIAVFVVIALAAVAIAITLFHTMQAATDVSPTLPLSVWLIVMYYFTIFSGAPPPSLPGSPGVVIGVIVIHPHSVLPLPPAPTSLSPPALFCG